MDVQIYGDLFLKKGHHMFCIRMPAHDRMHQHITVLYYGSRIAGSTAEYGDE